MHPYDLSARLCAGRLEASTDPMPDSAEDVSASNRGQQPEISGGPMGADCGARSGAWGRGAGASVPRVRVGVVSRDACAAAGRERAGSYPPSPRPAPFTLFAEDFLHLADLLLDLPPDLFILAFHF